MHRCKGLWSGDAQVQWAAFPGRKFYRFTTNGTKSQLLTVALILAATGCISRFGLTAEEAANSLLLSVPLMGCRFLPSCTGTLHPLIILTSHTLFQLQHLPQKMWWSELHLEYQLWKNHRFVQQQDDRVFKIDLLFLPNDSWCLILFFTATQIMFSFIYHNSRGFFCSSNDHLRGCNFTQLQDQVFLRYISLHLSVQNLICHFLSSHADMSNFLLSKIEVLHSI